MTLNGDLEEKDALRLLRTLRMVRRHLGQDNVGSMIVTEVSVVGEESISFTVNEIVDKILYPYREFD